MDIILTLFKLMAIESKIIPEMTGSAKQTKLIVSLSGSAENDSNPVTSLSIRTGIEFLGTAIKSGEYNV